MEPRLGLGLWRQAMHRTGCPCAACACLDAAEARLLVRDAAQIWGAGHPGLEVHFDSIGRAG